MKRLVLFLGGCILLALLLLPTVSARKPVGAKKGVQSNVPKSTSAQPAQTIKIQQIDSNKTAEAMTAAPGAPLDPTSLKEMPRSQTLRIEEGENEEALESDLDPATLNRLKQQPY